MRPVLTWRGAHPKQTYEAMLAVRNVSRFDYSYSQAARNPLNSLMYLSYSALHQRTGDVAPSLTATTHRNDGPIRALN